jgi:hypothetical protein
MADEELVPVYDAPTEVDALLNRTLLQEAGIDVVERILESDWFEGVQQKALHSQLLVRAEDADRARELLTAFAEEAQSGELASEIPDDDTTAPPPA